MRSKKKISQYFDKVNNFFLEKFISTRTRIFYLMSRGFFTTIGQMADVGSSPIGEPNFSCDFFYRVPEMKKYSF